MWTDNKSQKLLEWIIIKYINNYKYHYYFYNNNYKLDINKYFDV